MKQRSRAKVIGLTLSAILALSGIPFGPARAGAAPTVYDVTVSDQDQQTVKGWGIFPSWNRSDWNRYFIDKTGAEQALFQDLGATLFRVMIPPGAGDGDGHLIDDKMQEVYDLIHAGETRDMHDYIISVWSPPVDMKTIPTVNGWTGTEHVRLRPDKEDAYTTYLVNAIQWLADHGASVPKALSFQNEPLSQIVSEWCYWGGDNGAQFQRVAKLLRTKLDAAGLADVQIIAPEGASYHENELLLGEDFSALANDPALDDAIGGIASHSYYAKGYDNATVYENYLDALNHVPDKDRWQTEYSALISGISDMDMAINAAQRLSGDMAMLQNNYWFWWLGWAAGRHPSDVGEVLLDGDGYTVTKSKAFYVLSKIFNNVPVGSKVRRIAADPASGLTTDDAVWMDGVAFVDGGQSVVLLVNPTDDAKTVNVHGLTGETASVYQLTSAVPLGQDMTLAAARNVRQGTASAVALPAKSVSVIVTSDTDTAPPHIQFDQSDSTDVLDASYAVRNPQFTVTGHLDEAGTLTINGESVPVADDLSFRQTVTLNRGMNTIEATAADTLGNQGNTATLSVRYDPSYLGLTLDQGSPSYTKDSAFTVSGLTNGSATVGIKQQFGGETVADDTYTVGTPDAGGGVTPGELIRAIAKDGWDSSAGVLGTAAGGQSVNSGNVWDAAAVLAPAEGAKSLRLKLNPGFARLNIDFIDSSFHGVTENLSAYRDTGALQFWVYTKRAEDSLSAVLESNANGVRTEARLPLSRYLSASDYGNKWVKVTIPLSDFDAASRYDPATNAPTAAALDWSHVNGIGFASQTAAYYDPYVDDLKLVYDNPPDTYAGPLTFSADLNLLKGDNAITVTAANGAGQQAQPAVVHAVYDPDPPVLTVPAEGSTTTTSYVLKGSVSEPAEVTVNGTPVSLKSDLTFTAIVPVVAGPNTLAVAARDPAGNESQAAVQVDCEPVEDEALAPSVASGDKTAEAPTIDGSLSEPGWNANVQVRKPVIGVSDNVVTFGTMWDENNLYAAVKVLDSDLKNDSDPSVTYQDDSVEIYVDGDNSRSTTYGGDDRQITLGWHDQALSVGGDIPGIRFAQQDVDGGYTVELAIPWSGIGIAPPQAGAVIGFDVANNDDDGHNNGSRESQTMWAGNSDNWRSTSAFGSLYLNDGKNVAVSLEHAGAITVDGALSESDWALGSRVAKAVSGASNNVVRFGTLNDAENLYIGIEVLDDTLKNDSAQAYQDDSVEVYLDADNSRGTSYDAYDHQITLGWHDGQLGMIGNLPGVQFAQRDIDGGYTVEMAIPWSSLNVTPARNITLGFDVGNNDDDGLNGGNRENQIMWNGSGNNWQDTSAFGHLLVHNLSLPLPAATVPEPDGLAEFADDNSTLSKIYAKTDHIAVQTSHPENFANDAASFIHTNDNPTPPESVVYRSPDGDIYSFDITTGLYSNTPQFAFYGSADGVSFTRIAVQSKTIGGANGYGVFSNTASGLPSGTKYLKIEFPGRLNWHERLLNVTYKYFTETTDPDQATFADEAEDLTKLNDKSANIVSVNGGSGLDKYGGDATRIVHRNDDSLNPEYVVYQSPAGDIRSFDINASAWTGLPSTVGFAVYGSADGTTYTALPASKTLLSSSSGFNTLSIQADGLQGGFRYLKIVFPFGTLDCDNWTATINKVTFAYRNVPDAPTLDTVALTADRMALRPGETAALAVSGTMSDGSAADLSQAAIEFASDNEQTATAEAEGKVSALAEGTANIMATVTLNGVTRTAELPIVVDGTPPATAAAADRAASNGWYAADVQVTLSAADSLSGVAKTEYKIGEDGAWTAYASPVPIADEGVTTLQFRSVDRAGNAEEAQQLDIRIDKTLPDFSLSANGEPVEDGASFEDDTTLTFKAWDLLSGLSDAAVSIDGQVISVDPQAADGVTIDLAGQVGSHTATVAAADQAGNRLEKTIAFTVTTSIDAMKRLLQRYGAEDTKQALANNLDQAAHQLENGRPDQAAKHMQDFLKHLDNDALAGGLDAAGITALKADAAALIAEWTK